MSQKKLDDFFSLNPNRSNKAPPQPKPILSNIPYNSKRIQPEESKEVIFIDDLSDCSTPILYDQEEVPEPSNHDNELKYSNVPIPPAPPAPPTSYAEVLKQKEIKTNQNSQKYSKKMSPMSFPKSSAPSHLRLPHHTSSLWRSRKPQLYKLASKQECSVEFILRLVFENIVECRLHKAETLDISVLNNFFEKHDSASTIDLFSKIASYALEVELLFQQPIPILSKFSNSSITLTSQQVRCLLSLMFICVFPKQEPVHDLPSDYTFCRVFCESHILGVPSKLEKIKCVLNYFRRQETCESLNLTFTRDFIQRPTNWEEINEPLASVELITEKNCTEDYRDKIMIDFANKFIGGGVLGGGAVQEEIMFCKHIEPIVALLFTEKLEDRESFAIKGVQRFNKTSGYKNSFMFQDNFEENIFMDEKFRNNSVIMAIDAADYSGRSKEQFYIREVNRELDKALSGFRYKDSPEFSEVVTGRWGCGVFGGDDELKFIIQWLAASACKKSMVYLLWEFPNPENIESMLRMISPQFKVSDVYRCLKAISPSSSVFSTILKHLTKI